MGITYSFKDVTASINAPTASVSIGYGAGVGDEGITIDANADRNTMTIGADGTGMHSLHADQSGTVTVRLLQTSPSNLVLQQLFNDQSLAGSAWGQNTIVITNVQSGDSVTATRCAFKKNPSLTYRKDGVMIDWVFESVQIVKSLGVY